MHQPLLQISYLIKKLGKILFSLQGLVPGKHFIDIQKIILNNKYKRKALIF